MIRIRKSKVALGLNNRIFKHAYGPLCR